MKLRHVLALNLLLYVVLLFAVFNGFGVSEVTQPNGPQVAGLTTDNNLDENSEAIDYINLVRSQNGSSPLSINPDLQEITLFRADDMSSNDYYSHIQPNGTDYYSLFPKRKAFSCENLNLTETKGIEYISESWLESDKGHRDCLLDPRAKSAGYSIVPYETDSGVRYISVLILSS